MKKFLSVLLGLLLMMVVSCDGGDSDSNAVSTTSPEAVVYDATGMWIISVGAEKASEGCPSLSILEPGSDPEWITQKGNRFSLDDDDADDELTGTVEGAQYTYREEWDEGTMHIKVTIAFTLDTSTTGTGTITGEIDCPNCPNCTYTYPVRLTKQGTPQALKFIPGDITEGGTIPVRYTCQGLNVSPALAWDNVPAGTQSLVLALNDPDADDFTHWAVYGIAPTARSIKEGVPKGIETVADAYIDGGALQLRNGISEFGYTGPCPKGPLPHAYEFVLLALDTKVSPVLTEDELEDAIERHVLGIAIMTATF